MIKAAIMGFGTIGSGVAEVLDINKKSIAARVGDEVELKYVLDLRDFEGDPIQSKIVHDYKVIAEDPEVSIVVETMGGVEPAYTFVKTMLEAGKHVTTSNKALVAAKGAELIALAKEKGLYLGAAPDTFLGAALQTARKAIDDGLIGEITSFEACANRDLDLLAGMFSFLRMEGGGICYDFGVYYLTALVSLFGPVDSLVASVRNLAENRTNTAPGSTGYGETFSYQNESQVFTILRMKNGVTGTFSVNGDSAINDQAAFTVYGKKGILKLTDPNCFGGEVIYIPAAKGFDEVITPQVLDYGFAYGENSRGLGPTEMAAAIREEIGRLRRERISPAPSCRCGWRGWARRSCGGC